MPYVVLYQGIAYSRQATALSVVSCDRESNMSGIESAYLRPLLSP